MEIDGVLLGRRLEFGNSSRRQGLYIDYGRRGRSALNTLASEITWRRKSEPSRESVEASQAERLVKLLALGRLPHPNVVPEVKRWLSNQSRKFVLTQKKTASA